MKTENVDGYVRTNNECTLPAYTTPMRTMFADTTFVGGQDPRLLGTGTFPASWESIWPDLHFPTSAIYLSHWTARV